MRGRRRGRGPRGAAGCRSGRFRGVGRPDRKSTRLNSSHLVISYAVFCLKKKNTCILHNYPAPHIPIIVNSPVHMTVHLAATRLCLGHPTHSSLLLPHVFNTSVHPSNTYD